MRKKYKQKQNGSDQISERLSYWEKQIIGKGTFVVEDGKLKIKR